MKNPNCKNVNDLALLMKNIYCPQEEMRYALLVVSIPVRKKRSRISMRKKCDDQSVPGRPIASKVFSD
jgi:hypothetical protein